MRKRYRPHVNPLKMSSLVPRSAPLTLAAGPLVEAELGCGDAQFLLARAQRFPERLFIGLDIRDEFLGFGRRALKRLALTNVHLETANLLVDAPYLFGARRVHRFYINFPDPWFKARQRNRRWLSAAVLPHLVDALCSGGEIFFQSDVWEVALDALGVLEGEERLENCTGAWSFTRSNPFGVRSSREVACEEQSLRIWRLLFLRRG